VAACVAACGGATSAGGADAGATDEGVPAPDGGVPVLDAGGQPPFGTLVADCPSVPPADGSACSHPRLDCEYGNDWDPACNTVAQCWTQGYWQVTGPSQDPKLCPTPTGLGPQCPASPPSSGSQTCAPDGTVCVYPAGLCACSEYSGPGSADASASYLWTCASPDPACPVVRPRIGSACTQEGLYCDYEVCGAYGGAFSCSGGVWGQGTTINKCAGG